MVAFCVAWNQNEYLLGKNGLEPANKFMQRVEKSISGRTKFPNQNEKSLHLFTKVPTLFWFFDWQQDIDFLLNTSSLIGLKNFLFFL